MAIVHIGELVALTDWLGPKVSSCLVSCCIHYLYWVNSCNDNTINIVLGIIVAIISQM